MQNKKRWLRKEAGTIMDNANEALSALAQKASDAAAKVRDDYVPLAKETAQNALAEVKDKAAQVREQAAATADDSKVKVMEVSKELSKKAAKKAAKMEKKVEKMAKKSGSKKHKSHKGLIALLLAGAAGATAYFFWKRSQPVEDPWAEAYWEDIANDEETEESALTPGDVEDAIDEAISKN